MVAHTAIMEMINAWYAVELPVFVVLVGGSVSDLGPFLQVLSSGATGFTQEGYGGLADDISTVIFQGRSDLSYNLPEFVDHIPGLRRLQLSGRLTIVRPHAGYVHRGVEASYRTQTRLSFQNGSLGDGGCWSFARHLATGRAGPAVEGFSHGR